MVEVAVTWTEIEGSKLIPVLSWMQMGKDIISVRMKYFLHIWSAADVKKLE